MIAKDARIYVAGHRGLVGSAILRRLQSEGFNRLITATHSEVDLEDAVTVRQFFDRERPEYVFLAAAFVGGIMANSRMGADFISRNLAIQLNVMGESFRHKVKKLLFLGSSCIYPREAPQPIREKSLLSAPLEETNEPYAIAKIAGLKMCESFNRQYGTDWLALMPTNLYGPYDNFDLESSHLLPALLRKTHLANLLRNKKFDWIRMDIEKYPVKGLDAHKSTDKEIENSLASYGITGQKLLLWGSGTPLRELMWSDDAASAALFVMQNVSIREDIAAGASSRNRHFNVGTGCEHSIAQIAQMVQSTIQYDGDVAFDGIHPDGTPRKLLDVSRLANLGWHAETSLEVGIPRYYRWYCQQR